MERLTRPNVSVVVETGKYIGPEVRVKDVGDKLLELILNGPTLNSVNKDVLRHLIRQLYDVLKDYEDTGLTPEKIVAMKAELEAERYRHDRVQDFCTAEGELLSRAKRDLRDISACFTCTGKDCGRGPAIPAESGTRCGGYQWNGCAAGKPLP